MVLLGRRRWRATASGRANSRCWRSLVYIAGMAMLSAPIPGVVYAGTLPVILAACGFYLAQDTIDRLARSPP